MPKKFNWIFVNKCKEENSLNSFLQSIPLYSTTNNNEVNCNICTDRKSHKMRQKYLLCTSKLCGKGCTAKYKMEKCTKKSLIKVFKINEHQFNLENVEFSEKKVGLTKSMKAVA